METNKKCCHTLYLLGENITAAVLHFFEENMWENMKKTQHLLGENKTAAALQFFEEGLWVYNLLRFAFEATGENDPVVRHLWWAGHVV